LEWVAENRKIAAILAVDVVGFSRLAGADEDGVLAGLRTLRSEQRWSRTAGIPQGAGRHASS